MYGFNLFPSYELDNVDAVEALHRIFINKEIIFGDAAQMMEWRDRHPHPNCGDNGWECFAVVSEFDYLFVCTDTNTPDFGATRWIVNNCDDDKSLTGPPFDNFFKRIELYPSAHEEYDDSPHLFYFAALNNRRYLC